MMFILYIVIMVASLILGHYLGFKAGAIKGLAIGRDMEFYLFVKSIDKLKIQSKYIDIVKDVQNQYYLEQKNIVDELTVNEG